MVALSPRFSVLAAFISLVSLSTSPLPVGAAVIPRAEENANTARFFDSARLQSVFRLSQTKAMKRHDECSKDPCRDLCNYLLGASAEILLKRAQSSRLWSVSKQGESYTVSHSLKHSRSYDRPRYIAGREEVRREGKIGIFTTDEKQLGYLTVMNTKESQQSYPVEAQQEKGTTFMLVEDSARFATVRATPPGHPESTEWCMGFNATSGNSDLKLAPCVLSGNSQMSQRFGHDETSHDLSPLPDTQQTGSAQSVLSRDDGQNKDGKGQRALVILRFIPKEAQDVNQAANAADVSADDSPTATMTKTVTVTNTPAASLSTASTAATGTINPNASSGPTSTTNGAVPTAAAPSVNATTSATNEAGPTGGATGTAAATGTAGTTSTANGAAPTAGAAGAIGAAGTAGAAGVLDVEVVQASSTPSAIASNNATAAPTPTMNPQAIASSIANPSATPVAGTPANGAPASGTPASGTPVSGTPASGTPASGTPASGTPASGTPASGTPASGTPAVSSSSSTDKSTSAGSTAPSTRTVRIERSEWF